MLFRPKPMIYTELENMMHYARAGFDALDPVAWGWQKDKAGGNSFLLIADLTDYRPLQSYLDNDLIMASAEKRRAISSALSSGLAAIRDVGLAHRVSSHGMYSSGPRGAVINSSQLIWSVQ